MQYKCYISSCQHVANSSFAFWVSLEFFFPNIYDRRLVESGDAGPLDMEGQLYTGPL